MDPMEATAPPSNVGVFAQTPKCLRALKCGYLYIIGIECLNYAKELAMSSRHKRELECFDCGITFWGQLDEDCELILCTKCESDFRAWIALPEVQGFYTPRWHQEFIRAEGNRHEREDRMRKKLLDEVFTEE